MENRTAWFDLDEVNVDYAVQLSRDLSKLGVDISPGYWWTHRVDEPTHNMMNLIKSRPEWWENLPAIESGLNLMKLCKNIGFHIGVLTMAPNIPGVREGKFKWVNKNIKPIYPNADLFIASGQKSLKSAVYGRVLVDDSPDYMDAWISARPRAIGLMPKYDYNANYEHPRVLKYDPRSNSIDTEIDGALRKAFDRKAGEEH